ncbi:uncharacterized protein ColSpa_11875 [Colletotrichum spaethianum]|uniref:Uncharacterized protein n=1 Tax=Colletotrichum spaethianum TaxID=700344 RepID=A0AA37PGA0_9PEZI|nr:uncharacterized protein ColSpa_11875 [Colletotrichum spaethianum]GKT51694.1 hypothetical protein ColSpa_11875 [Colletotrichum spaethianum]
MLLLNAFQKHSALFSRIAQNPDQLPEPQLSKRSAHDHQGPFDYDAILSVPGKTLYMSKDITEVTSDTGLRPLI